MKSNKCKVLAICKWLKQISWKDICANKIAATVSADNTNIFFILYRASHLTDISYFIKYIFLGMKNK